MTSVHNVKRLKRNRMGIVPGKTGEHRLKKFKNPPFVAVCIICKKEWRTFYGLAKCCSPKCSRRNNYLKNREKRISNAKKYYQENIDEITRYKHLPRVVKRRRCLERERIKKWSPEKKESRKRYNKEYQLEHLDKFRIANRKAYQKRKQTKAEAESLL